MPEILEIETYRALAERLALGRRIAAVRADDPAYDKGTEPVAGLVGATLVAARRRGKLLLLDTDDDRVLGLRFGMTGTLRVDGAAPIERLRYRVAGYDRWGLDFDDGGQLRISDPRRLGGVRLDPDESRLGPDAFSLSAPELAGILKGEVALKSRLLDQSKVAGIGNLLADEILWRAGLAPARPAGSLKPAEVRRLHRELERTLAELSERGGSHTGDLMAERHPGGHCPKDGAELRVATVGGRTSWWCYQHQR
jgi:formamidopyrimidine-DNA glycosylase